VASRPAASPPPGGRRGPRTRCALWVSAPFPP
jgi:hypothetical protein